MHQQPPGMGQARYVIVALFEPLEVGTEFSRRRWPAHVTLLANLVTAASVDRLAGALRRAVSSETPLHIDVGELALFGRRRDIPVRLVLSDDLTNLHDRLADEVETLGDIQADEPAHWRAGYRPHLTLGPGVEAAEGERRVIRDIAVARLEGSVATVAAAIRMIA